MFEEMSSIFSTLVGSEYLPDVELGVTRDGIMCQDIMNLTFEESSFDLIMSFDVIEHVPDFLRALSEAYRVLRPGGTFLFTVPIDLSSKISHRRARVRVEGSVEHILEPEYHGNPLGPPSLCFTSFGFDLVDSLKDCGFSDAYAQMYGNRELGYWGPPQPLIVAVK